MNLVSVVLKIHLDPHLVRPKLKELQNNRSPKQTNIFLADRVIGRLSNFWHTFPDKYGYIIIEKMMSILVFPTSCLLGP
jgi:hypothetical protein